jgi:hypothetical protein
VPIRLQQLSVEYLVEPVVCGLGLALDNVTEFLARRAYASGPRTSHLITALIRTGLLGAIGDLSKLRTRIQLR